MGEKSETSPCTRTNIKQRKKRASEQRTQQITQQHKQSAQQQPTRSRLSLHGRLSWYLWWQHLSLASHPLHHTALLHHHLLLVTHHGVLLLVAQHKTSLSQLNDLVRHQCFAHSGRGQAEFLLCFVDGLLVRGVHLLREVGAVSCARCFALGLLQCGARSLVLALDGVVRYTTKIVGLEIDCRQIQTGKTTEHKPTHFMRIMEGSPTKTSDEVVEDRQPQHSQQTTTIQPKTKLQQRKAQRGPLSM